MKYKAIIFDLDGTLIDSMSLWRRVDMEFLNSRGIEVPTDLFAHLPHGNSFIQTAQYFKDRFGLKDSTASIMQEWTDMVSHHYENDVLLKPGVGDLVRELHAKQYRIGLGTSNSLELAQKSLIHNDLWQFFSCAVTGDEHLKGKPFPDIYLLASERLDVTPKECLVIEDTLTGVQAGKTAGMDVFAIYDADSTEFHPIIKTVADGFFADYSLLREAVFSGE
ncbi:MAG: HAD family phosphatase [Candidatus Cloacimonetes bacterium]|nr:HAD family phosphatase [Candidatus Cloacimonadota bacterium]